MKKLSPEHRARLLRAAAREERKKQKRAGYAELFSRAARGLGTNYGVADVGGVRRISQRRTIRLAGELDMLGPKCNRTLSQLQRLTTARVGLGRGDSLFIDISRIRSIDPPSLLFLCSRIYRLAAEHGIRVRGNYPDAQQAREVLVDADFESFLVGAAPRTPDNAYCLRLRSGLAAKEQAVDPQIAKGIKGFLMARARHLTREEGDHLYAAVLECLANVSEHAYGSDKPRTRAGWHVVGWFDKRSRLARVAILDMGVGIKATLRSQIPSLGRVFKSSVEYLIEAASGMRTETQERKRGKGLLDLKSFAQEADGRRLTIISSGARVSFSSDGAEASGIRQAVGTIVCLEVAQGLQRQ